MERIVKTYEECFWVVQKPLNYRQSCTEAATGDGLITFAKFTGKNLTQSFFFNKVAGLRLATILKERLWYRCFPINFTKKTPILKNMCKRLLLVASWRTTYKLNCRELLLLPCRVYINISEATVKPPNSGHVLNNGQSVSSQMWQSFNYLPTADTS